MDFPRASGDEPFYGASIEALLEFSPREWG